MRNDLILIVCGGRSYSNREFVYATLNRIHAERNIVLIRTGGCGGADKLAEDWADSRGVEKDVCPADWTRHGRAAGPIRNGAMLAKQPRPHGTVAFPGGSGTDDMCRQTEDAGLVAWRPKPE